LPASRKTERALVEQVNTLRGELNWYSRTIQLLEGRAANLMAPQLVKMRRAARDCEQRLVEALGSLRVEDQEYANLQTAGAIPLESIRASLPEDTIGSTHCRIRIASSRGHAVSRLQTNSTPPEFAVCPVRRTGPARLGERR
jgi:hypothetical protein